MGQLDKQNIFIIKIIGITQSLKNNKNKSLVLHRVRISFFAVKNKSRSFTNLANNFSISKK